MAKTIFEEMGGKYERQGDYLIPCLTVPAEEEQPIGIWGQRHLDYLKHHCKVTYTNLLTSGRLNAYLADIDRQAITMAKIKVTPIVPAPCPSDVGRILRTFKIKKNVEVTDNGKIII